MAEKTKLDLYYHYSEKAGDIARNLAFAGFAVIWLFHADWRGRQVLPLHLLQAASLLVLALTVDLVHYCVKALYWAWFASVDTTPTEDVKRTGKIGLNC
jgi:hypothetical protein